MTIILDGTTGIDSPNDTTGNQSYTGTLTGGTGVVNLGSGQFYKDASGNVGIGTSSIPSSVRLYQYVTAATCEHRIESSNTSGVITRWKQNGVDVGYAASANTTVSGGSATDFAISAPTANLLFATGTTERMRIDSSGRLLVNRTTANAQMCLNYAGNSIEGFSINDSASSSGSAAVRFQFGGTGVGGITLSSSTTTYATSSDYRLKNTIAPMTGALDKIALLKPVTYKWKVDGSDGQGFIAHELAEVVPNCVTGEKDAVNKDGSIKAQGIDTSFLVATLTASIQELKSIVDAQAVRIAALESK